MTETFEKSNDRVNNSQHFRNVGLGESSLNCVIGKARTVERIALKPEESMNRRLLKPIVTIPEDGTVAESLERKACALKKSTSRTTSTDPSFLFHTAKLEWSLVLVGRAFVGAVMMRNSLCGRKRGLWKDEPRTVTAPSPKLRFLLLASEECRLYPPHAAPPHEASY